MKKKSSKKVKLVQELSETLVSPEDRLDMIAEAAYYKAEQRGFHPGGSLQDWLDAEITIDNKLASDTKKDLEHEV